jgi:ribosomal-protein-serine acetyltransferase
MSFQITINEKLALKLRSPEDASAIYRVIDNNREHLRVWLDWVDNTRSPEDVKKFIIACNEGFQEKKSADFGIWYDGEWVGSMGFHNISERYKTGAIGYWLDKEHQGKGIMTACVKAITEYGFNELGLNRVEIECSVMNEKSKAVAERLGFVLEGVLRHNRVHEGKSQDGLIFSMIKTEWKK